METPEKFTLETRTVKIPDRVDPRGFYFTMVTLVWECPICGGPRGEVFPTVSMDRERLLVVDGWKNPCGHVDSYSAVRLEAGIGVTQTWD